MLIAVNGEFQVGAVLGWDTVGKSAGYQYNGTPWLAMQIGWALDGPATKK